MTTLITDLTPTHAARGAIRGGLAAIFIGFGGFGTWAAVAPLDAAAVAPGQVMVPNYRKVVQHLEGGIVGRILVREGSRVAAGQPVILLDDTRARTNYNALLDQYMALRARQARLQAERDGLDAVTFGAELEQARETPLAQAEMAGQLRLFEARRRLLAGQIAELHQHIEQSRQEIAALQSQSQAKSRQLGFISEEVNTVRKLVADGLGVRPRLLALQRDGAAIEGERGEYAARIARTEQAITGAQMEIMTLQNQRLTDIVQDLRDTENKIGDVTERLSAARDQLERTVIRAPQSGAVVNLRVHTEGGVINPAEPLMDIVPQDTTLVVEARVRPEDMDAVHPGLKAQVRLTAYKQRMVPTVDGTVSTVSADRLRDDKTNEQYFLARVEIERGALEHLPQVKLYPGMPADVLIETGKRTAFDYMAAPITQALSKAFREK